MHFFSIVLVLFTLAHAAVLAWNPGCIKKPVGYGAATTGGQGGKTVSPTNANELKKYLSTKGKLIIDLKTTFDFTNSEGSAVGKGCFFNKCGAGLQQSLAQQGTCDGRPSTTVKYQKAGLLGLPVSSDKTIMSSNGKGAIVGKGLQIKFAKNVIVRDISITDINPEVIWAGDAIEIYSSQNVWIHHVTTRNIGRQHLVIHFANNKGITVSSCLFDGTTKHSAYCNNHHYWMWLIRGTGDEVTIINNHILNTSGRLPHVGGLGNSNSQVHIVGNQFDSNPHTGIEPHKGAYILVEGNNWNGFSQVIDKSVTGGHLAFVTASNAAQCKNYFGQNCKANNLIKSTASSWFETTILQTLAKNKNAINSARAASCL